MGSNKHVVGKIYGAKREETVKRKILADITKRHKRSFTEEVLERFISSLSLDIMTDVTADNFDGLYEAGYVPGFAKGAIQDCHMARMMFENMVNEPGVVTVAPLLKPEEKPCFTVEALSEEKQEEYKALEEQIKVIREKQSKLVFKGANRIADADESEELLECTNCGSMINWSVVPTRNTHLKFNPDNCTTFISCPVCHKPAGMDASEQKEFDKLMQESAKLLTTQKHEFDSEIRRVMEAQSLANGKVVGWIYTYDIPFNSMKEENKKCA